MEGISNFSSQPGIFTILRPGIVVKECADVQVEHCFFNLRYPFWHGHGLAIRDSEMTSACRAALWYSDHIEITDTKLHGI